MKVSTLCFLVKDDQILLALKKRSFGIGRWNGVGGKVNPDETIRAAAIRELHEEIGIICQEADLDPRAILQFRSENSELDWDAHVFFLKQWHGEPQESEEMRPQWYSQAALPFDTMWPDDKHWLPHLLAGKRIKGIFHLDPQGKEILKFEIREV